MARCQAKRSVAEVRQQPSVLKGQGKRPQGIRKKPAQISPRRSDRLNANTQQRPSPASNLDKQSQQAPPQDNNRKRKRSKEPEDPHLRAPAKRFGKRSRTSVAETIQRDTEGANSKNDTNPVGYWIQERSWPKEYFEQESDMVKPLPRERSVSPFPGTQLEGGSGTPIATTPSDQKPREAKSTPYQSAQYKILLETKGSFMRESELGIADASKSLCQTLLQAEQIFPEHSLFQDDIFDETCDMLEDRNEAKVIQDIARLIVPSPESLAIHGAKSLKILIESVNEGWNNSFPITQPRPQPDFGVGFRRAAFTEDQLKKLQSLLTLQRSPEVKCGAAALDIADRQNAHSMAIAVRGIVELFRLVGREKELHREVLTFSISHDNSTARIYGYYPVFSGKDYTTWRHPIDRFDFTARDGREKWTGYQFTMNILDIYTPIFLKRICSVIDELPLYINFEVSELQPSETSGLSQVFGDQSLLQQSNADTASLEGNGDSQSSVAGSITPSTSLSHGTEQGVFKKPKKRHAAE